MKILKCITLALASLFVTVPIHAFCQIPAFPGAQGHGSTSFGGSGRHLAKPSTSVFRVTNLNESGTGSLRSCVEAKVPRVCVFEVAGRIHLTSELRIKAPYITIAGQTAPPPGIMLTGTGLRIAAHNVVVQHLQLRPGDGTGIDPSRRDGLTIAAGTVSTSSAVYNVIADHLSISWAIDENVDVWNPVTHDVTVSNSIVAEGLSKSKHPEGEHSKGVLLGSGVTRVSLHNSLLAHNWDRNPRTQDGSTIELINNVVYNWGGPSGWNGANVADSPTTGVPIFLNFIGNFYKRGKSSPNLPVVYGKPVASKTRVYALSNLGPTRTSDTQDDWLITSLPSANRATSAVVQPSGITTRTPNAAFDYVLNHAGARPRERNVVDSRIVSEVRTGSGDIKDCVSGCSRSAGGWPSMSQISRKLSIPADPNGDADGDTYTNLEEWLHEFAASVE